MLSKIILAIACLCLLSCTKGINLHREESLLIAAYHTNSPKGIYLISLTKSDTTFTLIDSSHTGKIVPDDLKFIDKKHLVYNGRIVADLSSNVIIKELPNRLSEQISASSLTNDKLIILDSCDISYYDEDKVKRDDFSLLCYDLNKNKEMFSIHIQGNEFRMNGNYSVRPKYIYYPDYYPKSASANNWRIIQKVLELETGNVQNFDTVFSSSVSDSTKVLYFNQRYVRKESGNKISYLKIYRGGASKGNRAEIIEWDYQYKRKTVTKEFDFNYNYKSDNYKHRLNENRLYLCFDSGIIEVIGKDKFKKVYFNEEFKFLDFIK